MKSGFEKLAGSFPGRTVGSEVRHLATVTSTMDIAWELAHAGAADGTVIVADHQTAGRGRFNRSWVSQQGQDVLCSVVLRPRVSLAGELLMLAALAVVDIAESYGIDTGIKWPNDVQVNGKKLAGVIAESVSGPAGGSGEDHNTENNAVPVLDNRSSHITAVIGIGLNVNFVPADHAGTAPGSTSLAAELGRQINRSETFEKLVRSLNDHYSGITAGGSVIPAWRQKLTTLDRRVTVVSGEPGNTSELHGLAHDVDSSGRLIVRDENGRDWPVAAGEVTVREIE